MKNISIWWSFIAKDCVDRTESIMTSKSESDIRGFGEKTNGENNTNSK